MKKKIVFAGLRHIHIFSLLDSVLASNELELAGCAEEDGAARGELIRDGRVDGVFDNIETMLDTVDCDIVAIGDCYARRGKIAIAALKRGKHIISDKPLCTSLEELAGIEALAAAGNLSVGCMFDMRTAPAIAGAKQLIESGVLGEIVQIQFSAQHPLMKGSRPGWYFTGNMHGGTINDIGSHAADLIPWLTGSPIAELVAARTWKAMAAEKDDIYDAGQLMFTLENGCGVIGDVSYSVPDSHGYTLPTYWRFNVWGKKGMIEFNYTGHEITAYFNGLAGKTVIAAPSDCGKDYLESFLSEIDGVPLELNTRSIITASRTILQFQSAADAAR